ncbi:hypothetical protein FPQ18DRAFT_412609 [Pyronema domesticum]|nr:hypothetical protein FPQ18DRAFT_412609 [Pyronema domesticum]
MSSFPQSLGLGFPAKKYTPLSALGAINEYGVRQDARLYYVDPDGFLAEAIYFTGSNTWRPGNLRASSVRLPEGSKFTSCDWVPRRFDKIKLYHHIFYQQNDGAIFQTTTYLPDNYISDPWVEGRSVDIGDFKPAKGSALSTGNDQFGVENFVTQGLRLYYQSPRGDIATHTWNRDGPAILSELWETGETVVRAAKPVESMAVVPKLMANGTMEEENLFYSQDGSIMHFVWTRAEGWKKKPGYVVKDNATGNVAAGGSSVYWQDKGMGEIREVRLKGTKWEPIKDKIA